MKLAHDFVRLRIVLVASDLALVFVGPRRRTKPYLDVIIGPPTTPPIFASICPRPRTKLFSVLSHSENRLYTSIIISLAAAGLRLDSNNRLTTSSLKSDATTHATSDKMTDRVRRNGQLSSCEPCRRSKLRCDHSRPQCARCIKRKLTHQCVYHPAPMAQRKRPSADLLLYVFHYERHFRAADLII